MVKENKPVKNPKFYDIDFLEKRLGKIKEKKDKIADRSYALGRRVRELSRMKPRAMTPFLEAALKHGREELRHGGEALSEMEREKKAIRKEIKRKKDKQKKPKKVLLY